MKKAIVLDSDDIKKLIAEKYSVDVKDIIKSQYSYTVILEKWLCKSMFCQIKETVMTFDEVLKEPSDKQKILDIAKKHGCLLLNHYY